MSVTKKKFSKKNKSSWRKYINIKDVEDYLEAKREEERIGSVSEKQDHELFTIDNSASKSILSLKQKRRQNAMKPPRNISSLENTSKVLDPLVQRDRVKLRKNGRDLFEEVLNPKKSTRVQQSIEDRERYYKKLEEKVSKKKVNRKFHDVWMEDDDPDKKEFFSNQWFTQNLALHNLKNIGKPVVKVHDSMHHKTTLAKKFELPHPGMSYNPSLKDHQDLLQKAVEREEKIIKEEKHLKRVTTDMFNKVTAEQRDSNLLKELSSGLPDEQGDGYQKEQNAEDCGGESDESGAYQSVNPPVVNKKKDKKARRKQKEEQERLKELEFKKEQKKKVTDIHRLKYVNEEVKKDLETLDAIKRRRKLCKKKKKFEPKRIAKRKYEEPEIAVNMAEDIAGNLRNIKTESNLILDRFKDLQRRNILPPTVDMGARKKKKVKRFVRSSHKDAEVL